MNGPKSFTFLIFFVAWSVFKGVESLIRPASSKLMFDEYNVGLLYYLTIGITVLGGIGLIYAITKRQEWGYKAGVVWLVTGVLYMIYTGFVSITNKVLMEQMMIATREAKGRPVEGITDFINSSAYDVTIIATTVVMIGIMGFFLWKMRQHKSYFSNAVVPQ